MKRKLILAAALVLLLLVGWLLTAGLAPPASAALSERVAVGPLVVSFDYEGRIEARRLETIMSRFPGNAAIVELAPDGVRVKQGDLLVRFDSAQVEIELLKLERDLALAKADMQSIEKAQQPLELRDIETQLLEARSNLGAEDQYLQGSRELRQEDLVSEQEIKQQELKVEQMRAKVDKLDKQLQLTSEYLHPSQLERARATLQSVEQQLGHVRRQIENCVARAPADGLVVYRPLHIGNEYRTVRVGDSIYRNQPFMVFPDMSDLIVHCYVPEAELANVATGRVCTIAPIAYPDLQLAGHVESVGFMAQTKPGMMEWQKYFHVVIGLDQADERLRTDMSVRARVHAYENPAALLLPRAAVWWEDGAPRCKVRRGRRIQARDLKLGRANLTHFEVLDGLAAGETVVME